MGLDVRLGFSTACDLYFDGRPTRSFTRRKAAREPIVIELNMNGADAIHSCLARLAR